MEKPGSRSSQHQLIINSPSILRVRDRFTDAGLTLFFWALMLYLWQPVLSMLAWLFQGYVFFHHMISLSGYGGFAKAALGYFQIIFLSNIALLTWARLNMWRFRNKDRRATRSMPTTSLLEHCLYFNVEPQQVEQWRNYRCMTVFFNNDGSIKDAQEVCTS